MHTKKAGIWKYTKYLLSSRSNLEAWTRTVLGITLIWFFIWPPYPEFRGVAVLEGEVFFLISGYVVQRNYFRMSRRKAGSKPFQPPKG